MGAFPHINLHSLGKLQKVSLPKGGEKKLSQPSKFARGNWVAIVTFHFRVIMKKGEGVIRYIVP